MKILLGYDGIIPDLIDRYGRMLLSKAVEKRYETVIEVLLDHSDITPDLPDHSNRTPLSWAAARGQEAVVGLLLTHGDVIADTRDSYQRIHNIPHWWKDISERWSPERGEDSLAVYFGSVPWTPLYWAASRGHETVVRRFLNCSDVEADFSDKIGHTPLSYATEKEYAAVVELLLACNDIEINKEDEY